MLEIDLPARLYHENGEKVASAFEEACEWLQSLGVFSASNRFSTYLKILNDFSSEKPYALQSNENFQNYIMANGEVTELIRIRKWLNQIDSDDYLSQLKKVTSGKPFLSSSKADPARDFAFELSMAARFLAAGYPVDVTGTADTIVQINSYKLYIECKRIQSPAKFFKRIKEAQKQIKTRLLADPSTKSRGLAACKITDILRPAPTIPVYPNAAMFRQENERLMKGYISENKQDLNKIMAKKQLGIFFESTLDGVTYDHYSETSHPQIVNCRGAIIFYDKLGNQDENLLRTIAPKIANQGIF